jgi:hypothetical protein
LQYSPTDAAYTPTDYVLRQLSNRKDCRWLSATNADNIYGTEVIERVRKVLSFPEMNKDKHSFYQKVPDIVLVPIDSRNWAEIGKSYCSFSSHYHILLFRLHGKKLQESLG